MSRALNVVLEMESVFPEKYVRPWKTKADIKSIFSNSGIPVVMDFKDMKLGAAVRNSVLSLVGSYIWFFKGRLCHFYIKARSKEQARRSYLRLALIFKF